MNAKPSPAYKVQKEAPRVLKNMIANLILAILPKTRWFSAKRVLMNLLGFRVAQGAKICGGVRFYGRGSISIGVDTWIGLNCDFYTSTAAGVHIGSNCDIAPGVVFHTGTHAPGGAERRAGAGTSLQIIVGDGSWVGVRTTILAGADIGPGCIVAAGAIVRGGVYQGNHLMAGIPAHPVKNLNG